MTNFTPTNSSYWCAYYFHPELVEWKYEFSGDSYLNVRAKLEILCENKKAMFNYNWMITQRFETEIPIEGFKLTPVITMEPIEMPVEQPLDTEPEWMIE